LISERYPQIPRRVSGYNLGDLLEDSGFDVAKALVGSESTCVLVLEATVRLLPEPPHHALLVVGYPDAATAADHVPELLGTAGLIGLECFDAGVLDNLAKHGEHIPGMDELPPGAAWLLAEYGAQSQDEANDLVESARSHVGGGQPKLFEDSRSQSEVWEVRRSTIEYTRIPGEHAGLAGWEDAAVAPDRLGDYIRDYCALVAKHRYHTVLFGHFGQGCMHNRLDLDLETAEAIENFGAFLEEAGDLVVAYGGSLSGEHGDGQLRANQLVKMYGAELVRGFAEFKQIFDPAGRMNPGKIVAPYHPTQNLRQGTSYEPAQVETFFAYPEDRRGFADAVNRCFGIGKCRHTTGGTMCPSFMVTREERHSTRGRARLLSEMMSGHLRERGWRDPHVKEALDLCLSCKGCKGDCPVSVDMATYKAEFLAHYYRRRVRPRQAYALGLIPVWARLASHAPGLVNAALTVPVAGRAAKLAAGVEPRRSAPSFAARPFRAWFAQHRAPAAGKPVLLWPDTFTNYFTPEVGIAAVEVLEDAGYQVRLPGRAMCCGRPLYDYGMLPTAKRWLRRILAELREPAGAGIPLIGLEPSCLAVFRDELPAMFPGDATAARLARQSLTLGEFLGRNGYTPPRLEADALVQVHCHQGAVLSHDSEQALLEHMGLRLTIPDSGCCGMAGSFGYEHGQRYQVSRDCGERVILPAVRDAPHDALIIADGFSCREQIAQATDRRPLHLAQVLRLAKEEPPGPFPERSCWEQPPRSRALLAGAGLASAATAALALRRLTGGTHG
jgi:Fe-S oxidoreductase